MRKSDLEWVVEVVRSSGIGTRIQREAIIQRIRDAYTELKADALARAQKYSAKLGATSDR